MTNSCQIRRLGHMEYGAAWGLQKQLVAKRAADQIPDTLLVVEHPHTFTIGIDGHREHLLISQEEMARLKIAYYEVDRGGSVTYHGPGQLVIYPILNLREYGYSYHQYIQVLEKVIIHALAQFNIRAFRERGQPGVWTFPNSPTGSSSRWMPSDHQAAKIAAVGVKVNEEHITSHGFAINVQPKLEYFDLIMPCGLPARNITSMRRVLNQSIEIGWVTEAVIQSFSEVFELQPIEERSVPQPVRSLVQPQAGSYTPVS